MLPLFLLISWLASTPADKAKPTQVAVERTLPLLQKSLVEYPKHRDCFSCHNQAVPVFALSLAKERGFAIDESLLQEPAEHTQADLFSAIDSYRKGDGQPGGVTRSGYAMWTLQSAGWEPDETTAAVVSFLLIRDKNGGAWRESSHRPPSEASTFTTTYVALRALRAFGSADRSEAIDARIAKARTWLETAKVVDNEDRVFRLWGLQAAGASEETIAKAVDELLSHQDADGGWSQLDGQEPDAYATATSLVVLRLAGGIKETHPAFRIGLEFLVRNQREDGSWYVPTRSKAFQPYFESGFPYGKDQFISVAASGWATAALILAESDPKK